MAAKKTAGAKKSAATKSDGALKWDKLKHAGGSAKLLPQTIGALRGSGYPAKQALRAVEQALVSPGKVFSASAPALALLIEAAGAKGALRAELLAQVLRMLLLGEVERCLANGLDLRAAATKKRYSSEDAQALLAAARAARKVVATWTRDSDERVRAHAATLLGFIPSEDAGAAAALLHGLRQEASVEVRARRIFSALLLAKNSGERVSFDVQSDDALTRAAARVARDVIADAATAREDTSAFLEATMGVPRDPIALDDWAFALLGEKNSEQRQLDVALAATDALSRKRNRTAEWKWPDRLLAWFLPMRKGARSAYVSDPVDVSGLTPTQRRVLKALNSVPHHGDTYDQRGLPPDVRSRRRLLGLAPPGVMEDVLKVERAGKAALPRWRIVRLAVDKHQATSKTLDIQSYLAKDWFDLTPAQWLELWTETTAKAYGHTFPSGDPLLRAIETSPPDVVHAWSGRYYLECTEGVDDELAQRIGWHVALGAIRANGALGEKFEAILTIYGTSDVMSLVLTRMSEEGRTAWGLRVIPSSNRTDFVVEELVERFPVLTHGVLAYLERRDEPYSPKAEGGEAWALTQLRKKVPAVDAILSEYTKKKQKA